MKIDTAARSRVTEFINLLAINTGIVVNDIEFNIYPSMFDKNGPSNHPLITVEVEPDTMPLLSPEDVKQLYMGWKREDIGAPFVEFISSYRSWYFDIGPIINDQTSAKLVHSWGLIKKDIIQILNNHLSSSSSCQWASLCRRAIIVFCIVLISRAPIPQTRFSLSGIEHNIGIVFHESRRMTMTHTSIRTSSPHSRTEDVHDVRDRNEDKIDEAKCRQSPSRS